ncbi:MAG: hypothetical protein KJZ84_16425 [Bryobacteraceae bacterium]|nr:hypothetical protein [Bryobacteraceae bacterium]
MKHFLRFLLVPALAGGQVITVSGTRFEMDGEPFHYTGVSFFNALFNPEFSSYHRVVFEFLAKGFRFDPGVRR